VLRPRTNAFAESLEGLIRRSVRVLVVGGCTLNSCIRVSATQLQRRFGTQGLQVIVDLATSGARAGNYAPSPEFDGLSPVAAAVRQMQGHGVVVAREVTWQFGAAPG
jgi:hypothetical protein